MIVSEFHDMNRLILIGNGFDLAHGFKTSYNDFILDYYKKIIESFVNEGITYSDKLFQLGYKSNVERTFNEKITITSIRDVKKFIDRFSRDTYILIKFHSTMFIRLYQKLNKLNWIEIENEYFELLIKHSRDKKFITKLNSEFTYLREKLESYLVEIDFLKPNYRSSFANLFSEDIKKEDIVTVDLDMDIIPNRIYFLNFNYTSTIDNYYEKVERSLSNSKIEHNFIHGELKNLKNPIIFGFGDELDEKYKEFENLKNDELFTHIKSFKYFQTENYHNLIRFIESEKFQVYIIGHSCGLSDRTMLNQIFEHDNCKSIKIFYHQKSETEDDFTEKTYEISRHFKDKGLMRKKLVPKSKSRPMPKARKIN